MRRDLTIATLVLLATLATSASAQRVARDWGGVETTLGRKGAPQAGGVTRFSFPRTDLTVTVKGVVLKPAFALGGWVAFKEVGDGSTIAMGDLVLTDDEVPAVMRALQAGGIAQTALHNHVLGESPHLMYMHVSAHGDPASIARTIAGALANSHTPMTSVPPQLMPAPVNLDTAGIAKTIGATGRVNGGVLQFSVPRAERIMEMGQEILPSMGVATAINFQPTGGGKAAITGDFVLLGAEVNPVIKLLGEQGIDVTALHSHMVDEEPRLYFMHFWANDNAMRLATALGKALQLTARK